MHKVRCSAYYEKCWQNSLPLPQEHLHYSILTVFIGQKYVREAVVLCLTFVKYFQLRLRLQNLKKVVSLSWGCSSLVIGFAYFPFDFIVVRL